MAATGSLWAQRAQLGRDPDPGRALSAADVDALAHLFAATLRAEAPAVWTGALDGSATVPPILSECSVHAPRAHSAAQRRYGLAERIADLVFPPTPPDDGNGGDSEDGGDARLPAVVRYTRLIAALARLYHQQQQQAVDVDSVLPASASDSAPMCLRRVHPDVAEPKAMPVDVAPPAEFAEFFAFLRRPDTASAFLASATSRADPRAAIVFPRGIFYADGRMDLCKQVVGPPSIGALMDAIRGNPHVQHFLLGNNIIDRAGADAIAAYIAAPHANAIRTWYLAGNALDADGVAGIAAALATDTDATELWLKRNPLKPAGAAALGRMVQHNATLVTLDLDVTGLLDAGAAALFGALRVNSTLRHLHLGGNGLTAVTGAVISDYFEALTADRDAAGLESLWIDVNHLGDAGLAALAIGVRAYTRRPRHAPTGLRRLSVGSNGATVTGVRAIVDALADSPETSQLAFFSAGLWIATRALGAAPNVVGDAAAPSLARLIATAPALAALGLTHHALSPRALDVVLRAAVADRPGSLVFIGRASPGRRPANAVLARTASAAFLARVRATRGISYDTFVNSATHPAALRFVRSPPGVEVIDSIYRNQATTEARQLRRQQRKQLAVPA